jgi:shikimate 5-dehydrogenase
MKPEEIKPDTKLCTILGYNAQTGKCRKYFNKILKENGVNATAIALNIKDEHLDTTLEGVAFSKVEKMMFENEFREAAVLYCDVMNKSAIASNAVDYIEVRDQTIYGYCLDEELASMVNNPEYVDTDMELAIKMMLLANKWYGIKIDMDLIPTIL